MRDVFAAIAFHVDQLGFTLRQQFCPAMGILGHGDLTLWLAGAMASAAKPMPVGRTPEPGGWGRFVLEVGDLPGLVARLRGHNLHLKAIKAPPAKGRGPFDPIHKSAGGSLFTRLLRLSSSPLLTRAPLRATVVAYRHRRP